MNDIDAIIFYNICETTHIFDCAYNHCAVVFICESGMKNELPIFYAEGEI